MLNRRTFVACLAPAILRGAATTSRQRVDRAIGGEIADRPPISLWHHFELEKQGPAAHAKRTLQFHQTAQTDLVKVMSDFPYPKPAGNWWELKELASPYAPQLEALAMIREGLRGEAHFVETIFNPWNVAEKLSSKEAVLKMKNEQPQKLLDALTVIAKSEANHVGRALSTGVSGIFLAIANAQKGILTPEEYKRFSEPFDRMVLQAAAGAPLNILHLHGDKVYVDPFIKGWTGIAINYSAAETGITLQALRAKFSGVILGGVDQRSYRTRTVEQLKADTALARKQAGERLILCPGCSVPNDTTADEIAKLRKAL